MFATATGQTPGAIYELLSRGLKDKYFFSSEGETATTPFSNTFTKAPRHISETRQSISTGATNFASTIEFDLDRYGDILTDVWFQIDLPSWIPSSLNVTNPANFRDASGNIYTYQDAAGFFLFENIQILQGQMTILETSGDALYWLSGTRRRLGAAELIRQLGGDSGSGSGGSDLRIKIPFPGCQGDREGGFPLCALPDKTYKIRAKLRKLADIVSWSRSTATPWGKDFYNIETGDYAFTALNEYDIAQPTITLETTQAYIPQETSLSIRRSIASDATRIHIPYLTHYEQAFQIRPNGRQPYLLEPKHPSEAIYIYAREQGAARLKDISATAIEAIEFTLAGRQREFEWNTRILSDVAAHAKMVSPPPVPGALFTFNWSLGDIHRPSSQDPMQRRPEGTINFSEADRPTLYVTPSPAVKKEPPVFMHVIVESWKIYNIESDGRGRVAFI